MPMTVPELAMTYQIRNLHRMGKPYATCLVHPIEVLGGTPAFGASRMMQSSQEQRLAAAETAGTAGECRLAAVYGR